MKKSLIKRLMVDIGLVKMIRAMRLIVFILLVGITQTLAVGSYSQTTRLTLEMRNVPIEKVLEEIENSSEFYFLYNQNKVDVDKRVDVNVSDMKVSQILQQLFKGTYVEYTIVDRQIVLTNISSAESVNQQSKSVTGKVTDASGSPLPGVTVIVKGTTQGTITDAEGNYSLSGVPDDAVLVLSFVGMKTQEVSVSGKAQIDVTMAEETIGLEEVVAIGYGTQKKATVTGAIATVQGESLQKVPASNLTTALTGRMTGVVINTRGSAPGAEGMQINIRGKGTWQGGEPLIIIDGIANRSGFERLNPNDIESISILKDASAAIYGSRAANGVILVTTKRGKQGKPTIEYNGDFGLTQPTRVPEMARSWQYATYYTEAQRNGYMWTDEEIAKFKAGTDPALYPNYDLKDYLLQSFGPQTKHSISLRGGNDAIKYYVSGRYLYQDSFFKNGIDDFNSYNVRSNIDAKVSKNFTISVDIGGRRDDKRRAIGSVLAPQGDDLQGVEDIDAGFFEELIINYPTKPIFYSNGLPAEINFFNITKTIAGEAGETNTRTTTLNSQATAKWELPFITDGLFIEGTAAYDFSNVRTKEFSKSYDVYSYNNNTGEYINLNKTPVKDRNLYDYFYNSYSYTLNAKLGYQHTFGDHNINTFIGYEQYSVNTEWINATRNTFLSEQIPFLFAGDANTQKNDGSGSEFAYRNTFGRIAYNYKEKYLLDFTLRRDESLKFPKENRVGWFPGISVGWRLTEESFVKEKLPSFDNLKLRASYGQMGSDNVGDYQYIASAALEDGSSSFVLGVDPSVVSTLYFTGTPNPLITWEVANSYNVALEGSLWQGLLGFELEYFLSKRSNILATRNASVPSYAGMRLPDENIGKAQNQGVEVMLTHHKRMGNFSYGVIGNFTMTANKIIYMDESPFVPDYQRREGHPIDSYLLYLTDGIFNTQEEFDATPVKRAGAQLGDIKYIDVNDDGVIDDNDKVRLFDSRVPKIIYGLNFDFAYKGLEISMLWQGQVDVKTYVCPATRGGDMNIPMWMYNPRWTPENEEKATMPRAFFHRSESYNWLPSDFWLEDASFLRLKTLELAYNIPKDIVSKVSLGSARIYVSGLNLLLFDKLKNYDPEIANQEGLFYPATRVYNIGVNLTF